MNRFPAAVTATLVILTALPSLLQARAILQPVEAIYDFGGVGIDFEVLHEYKLVNTGSQPVRLDSVIANCDCSRVWLIDSIIAPGDTGKFGLSFSTKDYYGRTSKAIKVYANGIAQPYFDCFYLSTVGQWFFGLAPNPASLFFLPGQKAKKIVIPNKALKRVEITGLDSYNDAIDIKIIKREAEKGKSLELEVAPKSDLTTGTYRTNFRLTIKLPGDQDPLFLTIPVKIVRY